MRPTWAQARAMRDLLVKPITCHGLNSPAHMDPALVEAIRLGWITVERTYTLTPLGRKALR